MTNALIGLKAFFQGPITQYNAICFTKFSLFRKKGKSISQFNSNSLIQLKNNKRKSKIKSKYYLLINQKTPHLQT